MDLRCETVAGERLKQSGMEWTVRGANAIIALPPPLRQDGGVPGAKSGLLLKNPLSCRGPGLTFAIPPGENIIGAMAGMNAIGPASKGAIPCGN